MNCFEFLTGTMSKRSCFQYWITQRKSYTEGYNVNPASTVFVIGCLRGNKLRFQEVFPDPVGGVYERMISVFTKG